MQKKTLPLLAATALFWFALYTYPVLLTDFVQGELLSSAAFAGLIVGSYGFTQMVLRIPVGFATDRLRKRRPFIQFGLVMTVVAALLLYMARTPAMALIGRGSAGVAAATWACFTVLYAAYQGGEKRTRAMSTLSAVMYGAQLAATMLGSALARSLGTRICFLVAAGAGLLGLLCTTRVTEHPTERQDINLAALGKVLRDRMLWITAVLSILMQMVVWSTLYGFSPKWALDVLGADTVQVGLLSVFHLVPTMICSWAAGALLAPRLGERGASALGFGLLVLACAGLPFTTAFWQMLLLQVLCGAGVGLIGPMMLSLCIRDIAPPLHGIAMGTYQSIYGLGMFLGPMVSGALVEAFSTEVGGVLSAVPGYQAVFVMAALVAVVGCLGSLLLPGRRSAAAAERA